VLLSLGAFGINAVILLSDRAPGLFSRLSRRIDAGVSRAADATGLDVPGRDVSVAQSDLDIHVVIWAVAALLVGLAAWSWTSLVLGNGMVLAGSVMLEMAQWFYTSTRTVQLSDIAGNTVGVVTGTCAVAVYGLWWRITHRVDALR
jgi:hypothetical protein